MRPPDRQGTTKETTMRNGSSRKPDEAGHDAPGSGLRVRPPAAQAEADLAKLAAVLARDARFGPGVIQASPDGKILLLAFRSLTIAAVSILLNLLSVGAAYGLLTLVFIHGAGAGIFGFQKVPVIDAWVPLFMFSMLFALSTDYQVFLMSRIKERYDQGGSTREAV
jgi:MMPL family protein